MESIPDMGIFPTGTLSYGKGGGGGSVVAPGSRKVRCSPEWKDYIRNELLGKEYSYALNLPIAWKCNLTAAPHE